MKNPQKAQGGLALRLSGLLVHLGFGNGQELLRTMQEAHPLPLSESAPFSLRKVAEVKRPAIPDPFRCFPFHPDFSRNIHAVLERDNSFPDLSLVSQPGKVV